LCFKKFQPIAPSGLWLMLGFWLEGSCYPEQTRVALIYRQSLQEQTWTPCFLYLYKILLPKAQKPQSAEK
jgi:hypothetical protein